MYMTTKEILNSHSISTLKKEISKTIIKGYSTMKKNEIINLMLKNKERFSHIKMNTKTKTTPKPVKKQPVKKQPVKKQKSPKLKKLEVDVKKLIKRIGTEEYYKKYGGNQPNYNDGGELMKNYLKEYAKIYGYGATATLIKPYNEALTKNLKRE